MYKVNRSTGAIMWTLGGKNSSFRLGPGASFAFQHDVRVRAFGDQFLTMFDDGAGPPYVHSQSRALKLELNLKHMTADVVAQHEHSPPLLSSFEGSDEQLPDRDDFVGWGQQPYFSEYNPQGKLVFDGRFVDDNLSYRAYRFHWSGTPATPPAVATTPPGPQDDRVRELERRHRRRTPGGSSAASSATALKPIVTARKRGFETAITTGARGYVAVQALGSKNRPLGSRSAVVQVPPPPPKPKPKPKPKPHPPAAKPPPSPRPRRSPAFPLTGSYPGFIGILTRIPAACAGGSDPRPSPFIGTPCHSCSWTGSLVALAYYLAFRLRFTDGLGGANDRYGDLLTHTLPWVVAVSLVTLALFGQYQRLWTFVGQRDYEAVVKGLVVATLVIVGGIAFLHPVTTTVAFQTTPVNLPGSVIALFFLLALALLIGARFLVHIVVEGRVHSFRVAKGARDVLIIGGGQGGRLVVRELVRNPQLRLRPVGFVDDDPRMQGIKDEHGLKVLGTTASEDLARILDEVEPDEVVIAIPSAPGTLRARVVTACRERGIQVRTTPTVFELLQDGSGQLNVMRQLREVRVEDMLGREPVRMEIERVGAYLSGQVVMVTGAGGSIGAELCRQISRVAPRSLVLVDHAEDNLFEILRELEEDRHVRTAVPVLADCREEERMREVLTEHRPSVVFHAAAYKHVTMMEVNPVEAIRNNALATRVVARIAAEAQVANFVLVSTDKAVKPATVMGASKALAEWAVEAAALRYPGTKYATVRFGNVLGSSGSVVPIFRRQIAAGGPVTVTDPRMKRYFMTIPEAVQLIIRAGSLSEGSGEVFVLEMGEPIAIIDLAETMIRLSGLEPERDIAIEIVGARPGEKLHEDLFNPYERLQPTPAQKILRAAREPLDPAVGRADLRRDQPARARGRRRRAGAARGQAVELSLRRPRGARDRERRAGRPASPTPASPDSPRRLPARNMETIPFAVSVHHFISSVGADAGFAAFIAVALLVLLYFSQARETSNLRRRADEAGQRVQELEDQLYALSEQVAALPAEISVRAASPRAAAAYGAARRAGARRRRRRRR